MKTAKEILANEIGVLKIDGVKWDRVSGATNKIVSAMENYAQIKVNELNKSDVIKSVCEHDWYRSELMNERRCILCNEKEKIK